MKRVLECPVCGATIDVVAELNDRGLELLARRGPPVCLENSCARMRETWIAEGEQ